MTQELRKIIGNGSIHLFKLFWDRGFDSSGGGLNLVGNFDDLFYDLV